MLKKKWLPLRYGWMSPALLGALLAASCGPADPSGLVGKPVPYFAIEPVRPGGDLRSTDLHGKVMLIDFWATWCGPCRMLMPHLVSMQAKYGSKGLVVLGVSNETRDVVSAFREQNPGLNYDLFLDPYAKLAQALHAGTLPTTVLIDKDGTIRMYDVGFSDEAAKELDRRVSDLVSD